jgi:pyrroline-5-carboxylate reductase
LIAETTTENARAAGQKLVFLAVHPPLFPQVLSEISEHLREDAVVISLAPKLSIDQLSGMTNGFGKFARMIPNAPSIVGDGYNPVAWGEELPEPDRNHVRNLLRPLGQCPEVAESTLEAYAIITAMGPTYFWPQWSELVSLAETFGLSQQEAANAVQAMLQGAIATFFNSGLTTAEVCDLVPVKPLGDFEPILRETFQTKLTAVMEKIRPTSEMGR